MDYTDWIAGLLGGLLGSIITALVSLHILRKQFMREEKTIRESRSSEIMENVEASIWTILSGHINEHALDEKFQNEEFRLPTLEHNNARSELFNIISEEKMRENSRVQDAEKKLIQQRSLIELFLGSSGVVAFDEVSGKVPSIKKSLEELINNRFRIGPGYVGKEIKDYRPDEASNWADYSKVLCALRKILWNYADCKSFGNCLFCFRIKSKANK